MIFKKSIFHLFFFYNTILKINILQFIQATLFIFITTSTRTGVISSDIHLIHKSKYRNVLWADKQKHVATDTLRHAVDFYCNFYGAIRPDLGHACYGHDVLAFVWLVAPELFKTQSGRIRVQKTGGGNGQTMMDRHGGLFYPEPGWEKEMPETRVCMEVDAPACLTLVMDTLNSAWLKPALTR